MSDRTVRRPAAAGRPWAIVSRDVGDQLDRTTGLRAIVDQPSDGTWYLIVALDDQRNTRVVQLDDGIELVFGRSPEASVVIEHEAVSRRHTAVRRRGDAIVVQDLGSRN